MPPLPDTAQAPTRVALVHDFLLDLRGAERVFLEMARMWPEADIFTAVYDEEGTDGRFAGRTVHSSFLQRFKPSARNFRMLLPLYPAAIESFDLVELRPRHLQFLGLGPRRPLRRGFGPRELLPQPVPVCVERP